MKLKITFQVALFSLTLLSLQLAAQDSTDTWPNWRGSNVDGVSPNGTPPTEWSETKNIKWKTPIPGKGIGTPVVWGNQIFITTAIELDKKATEEAIKRLKKTSPTFVKLFGMSGTIENFLQFVVYSINRSNGEIIWKKVVREQYPHEGINNNGSWASASCATDGEHVIAFLGSYGIYCFNMDGNLIWEKDFGDMQIENAFGEGTSPVLYKDKLIIVWDHEGQSKIYVLNKKTGEEIWQKNRDEKTTWATPIVVEFEGKAQIIVPSNNKSIGYDLETGDVIWKINGLREDIIPCPVFDGERAFLMTKLGIQAINLEVAKDNLEHSNAVIWTKDKNSSYVPSPLLKNEKLYYLKGSCAQLSCVDAKNGEIYYAALKLEGLAGVYASPVWANGNIYIIDRRGTCSVIKDGAEFKVIAKNKLDDNFDASPAIVGNELLLRGFKSLYCISK
ncbi:MAG: PQQ-binding-like beta-propeller repeat protein [Bacteroidales bacterium]|nr:PQQ-binding-like beta-propeller repeat protein [Bacteroidales bacterium]